MFRLAESFSEEELFTKGFYKVTYTTSMAAYFLSVTPLRTGDENHKNTSEKLEEEMNPKETRK